MEWKIERIGLTMRVLWRISRSATESKQNMIITLRDGEHTVLGETAPNTRYGETHDLVEEQFAAFQKRFSECKPSDLPSFTRLLDSLHLCHSLRFGLESAFVHLLCKRAGTSIARFFNLPEPKEVVTSFSVPIMDVGALKDYIQPLGRFASLKIKVNTETGVDMIDEISKYTSQMLRIDGNEAWNDPDAFLGFIEKIKCRNIEFIEQPMPARMKDAYRAVKPHLPFPMIADESIEDQADFDDLQTMFHGVNVKLMKAGGYVKAVQLLQEARKREMKTMIGCMIETSLGIGSAFQLCSLADYVDLDGSLLLKKDPYPFIEENDGKLRQKLSITA